MKKIRTLLGFLLVAFAALSFTSCDEDKMIGSQLNGTWRGNMYVSSYYGGRHYLSSRTEIQFSGRLFNSEKGTGYWIDHYSGAPWDYWYSRFSYSVQNGVIYITFRVNGEQLFIRDYDIDYDYYTDAYYFTGYVGNTNESFSLVKVDDVNWNGYDEGYYYNDYYYARGERDFSAEADTAAPEQEIPVRKVWDK